MAAPFLIIDGYNLMHAAGMARPSYGPGLLEKCRMRLLAFLSNRLTPSEQRRTTVVFDAADALYDVPERMKVQQMTVLFAPRGGDADSLIEELIAAHSAPRQVRVVSSDHRLQKAARRRRAGFIDSEEFVVELQRHTLSGSQRPQSPDQNHYADEKYGGRVDAKETARWLKIFGDVPEAEELQDVAETLQDQIQDFAGEM